MALIVWGHTVSQSCVKRNRGATIANDEYYNATQPLEEEDEEEDEEEEEEVDEEEKEDEEEEDEDEDEEGGK